MGQYSLLVFCLLCQLNIELILGKSKRSKRDSILPREGAITAQICSLVSCKLKRYESAILSLIFSFFHFMVKFLILNHQNKTLIMSDFVSQTLQNVGYISEVMVQNSLLLVLNENCWLMPQVHLILTANLDFMLHFLGDQSLTKDTFACTLVQVVSISSLLIYQYQKIKNGRSRYESDLNAFLISD